MCLKSIQFINRNSTLRMHVCMCTYCSAFKEGHSVNVALDLISKLFFDGSPGVTQIMHLLRTHQLHSGVTLQKQNRNNK